MNIFKKLGQEVYHYESSLDVYALRLQMREKLAVARSVHTNLPSLKGKFTKQNEFEIWLIGEIAYIRRPGGPLPMTYIRGELVPNGSKTSVVVQIVPYTVWIPIFCSLLMGIVGLTQFAENTNVTVLIVSFVLIFGMPIFFAWLITKQKERLKATFNHLFGFTLVKAFSDEPLTSDL